MKRLAILVRPLLSRPMKRLAFSVAAAAAAFAFGACEKHSADNLPDHYLHKGGQHAEAGAAHGAVPAPAHAEAKKAPAPDHKG